MKVRQFLSFILILFLPLLQLQAEVAGVLHLKGSVWTNGSPARDGSAVSAGDKVQTGSQSFANVSDKAGNSIIVTGTSTAVVGNRQVQLESGAAVLAGKNLVAQVGGITATSSDQNSQFIVNADSAKIEIAAIKGSLQLRDGNQTMNLPEGKVVTKSRSGNAPVPAAPVSNLTGSTALVAILTSVAAAGIATGLIYAADDKTVSPSTPQ